MLSDPEVTEYLPSTLSKELASVVCGDLIGAGCGRRVYTCAFDESLVVKVELRRQSFQNVEEWEVWRLVSGYEEHADWFAPCVSISPCGLILFQKRTLVARESEYPATLPSYFTDTKRANFGILEGRFVCHDYGTNRLAFTGMTKRTRKADWW